MPQSSKFEKCDLKNGYWARFLINGIEKVAYSLDHTFPGEMKNTLTLVAHSNNVDQSDVCIQLVRVLNDSIRQCVVVSH